MTEQPIGAVLFDLDGTLIDSEPIWAVAEAELAARYGVDWTAADNRHTRGWALEDAAQYMRERGVDLPAGEIIDAMEAVVNEQLRESVPWAVPGARLLAECRERQIPTAIVTMSRRAAVEIVLAALPPDMVQVSIAGDEVRRGKPDPEPYLRAIEALDVRPEECVVLEDSVTGTTAGLAAGCRVVTVGPLAGTIPGAGGLGPDAGLSELLAAAGLEASV